MRKQPQKIGKQGLKTKTKNRKITSVIEEWKEVWKEYVEEPYDSSCSQEQMCLKMKVNMMKKVW